MNAQLIHSQHVQLPTMHGDRSFTDLSWSFCDAVYGSRYHGALSQHEISVETHLFMQRHKVRA